MKTATWSLSTLFLGTCLLIGCNTAPDEKPKAGSGHDKAVATAKDANAAKTSANEDEEKEIEASLAKLSREDRALAEQQKFCAINVKERLGEMGTPVKIMLQDQPVFLCCSGCEKKAKANPDKTVASAKELKANNAKQSTK